MQVIECASFGLINTKDTNWNLRHVRFIGLLCTPEAWSLMHNPSCTPIQGRSFVLHNDKNKLDQVSFKAESTKTKQVSDYIIYILSKTTDLLGSGPTRE